MDRRTITESSDIESLPLVKITLLVSDAADLLNPFEFSHFTLEYLPIVCEITDSYFIRQIWGGNVSIE